MSSPCKVWYSRYLKKSQLLLLLFFSHAGNSSMRQAGLMTDHYIKHFFLWESNIPRTAKQTRTTIRPCFTVTDQATRKRNESFNNSMCQQFKPFVFVVFLLSTPFSSYMYTSIPPPRLDCRRFSFANGLSLIWRVLEKHKAKRKLIQAFARFGQLVEMFLAQACFCTLKKWVQLSVTLSRR